MATTLLGAERYLICPSGGTFVIADRNAHGDVTMVEISGGETANPRHTPAGQYGVLKAAAGGRDLPEESQRVQKIGFTGRVGSDHEHPIP